MESPAVVAGVDRLCRHRPALYKNRPGAEGAANGAARRRSP